VSEDKPIAYCESLPLTGADVVIRTLSFFVSCAVKGNVHELLRGIELGIRMLTLFRGFGGVEESNGID
jgi:hypothetical protein